MRHDLVGSPLSASMLQQIAMEAARIHRTLRLRIEQRLTAYADHPADAGDAEALVRGIATLLDRHGLRIRCPRCHHPAVLRLQTRSGRRRYVFDHVIDGRRTFHAGGDRLPTLPLTGKPPRR